MRPEIRREYDQWIASTGPRWAGDATWPLTAYRLARFASIRAWSHTALLARDPRSVRVAGQLYSALGSICANLAEGRSRRSSADRARFYEYALGSAREAREWYLHAEPVLESPATSQALDLLEEIVRLLVSYVAAQRRRIRRPLFRRSAPEPPR